MHIYRTQEEIALAAPPLPPDVLPAFERRRRHTLEHGLGGMTSLIVVTAADSAADVADEIGGEITEAWVDGASPLPGGWVELVICVGDGGYAAILIVEPRDDGLGALCRAVNAQP